MTSRFLWAYFMLAGQKDPPESPFQYHGHECSFIPSSSDLIHSFLVILFLICALRLNHGPGKIGTGTLHDCLMLAIDNVDDTPTTSNAGRSALIINFWWCFGEREA